MVQLKWLGAHTTRVRKEESGEKFEVKPNALFEADEKMGKYYAQYPKEFQVVTQEVKKEEVVKAEVVSESEVTEEVKPKKQKKL